MTEKVNEGRRKYSKEFKVDAVELIRRSNKNLFVNKSNGTWHPQLDQFYRLFFILIRLPLFEKSKISRCDKTQLIYEQALNPVKREVE